MRIHFINVGYGEAVLVERAGFVVLIDGGTGRAEEYDRPGCIRVSDYMKKIGISKADLIIVTHIHDDHIGGIPDVIRNFPVFGVWINLKPEPPDLMKIGGFESVINGNLSGGLFKNALKSYGELLEECGSRGIPVVQKGRGDIFRFPGDGGWLELLTPDRTFQTGMMNAYERFVSELASGKDIRKAETLFYEIDKQGNSSSIVLKIQAGKTGALLSGDKVDGWEEIYEKYGDRLKSQILKVTHHGQMDGMPKAMLEAARPDFFVICADRDKRFNSAHPAILKRANAYLRERKKTGGVYITGCLQSGENGDNKEYCAVCFLCDENTGEITVRFEEI